MRPQGEPEAVAGGKGGRLFWMAPPGSSWGPGFIPPTPPTRWEMRLLNYGCQVSAFILLVWLVILSRTCVTHANRNVYWMQVLPGAGTTYTVTDTEKKSSPFEVNDNIDWEDSPL